MFWRSIGFKLVFLIVTFSTICVGIFVYKLDGELRSEYYEKSTPLKKSIDKIEKELCWCPRESFQSGIRKTIQWYLDHRDWVAHVTSGEYRDWIGVQYSSRGGCA